MLNEKFLLYIYKATYMQRWNDHLRPIDLYEVDKQAHKMIIAYTLAKIEEKNANNIDWMQIIEGGIFEFLQRIALTDIKPALFYKIKKDKQKYKELNQFIIEQMSDAIVDIENGKFLARFKKYLDKDSTNLKEFSLEKKILKAAHFLSTKWEFEIIAGYNRGGYQTDQIKSDMIKREQYFKDLISIKELYFSANLKKFLNLCAELRYQIRWNQLYRVPKTSVLGHMLIVAIISYVFSLEIKANNHQIFNNFFTGLFHDLPEVLTRDVISPIKTSVSGLDEFIKEYEAEEMQNVYNLLPDFLAKDIKNFTENEFSDILINKSPRDGSLIKIADKLSAMIEAYLTLKNGINNPELKDAVFGICNFYKNKELSNLKLKNIFNFFNKI